jgi:serine/threonine protein kinase
VLRRLTPVPPPGDTEHGGVKPLPLETDLRAGTTVAGYRLDAIVGRGGMGVVYRAHHVLLDRTAALKLLAPEAAADEAFRDRFIRESRMAAALEHPHVVPIYDAGEQDGLLYIAMRYIDGSDLGTLLDRQGALDPAQAVAIAAQVGSALDAAHERRIVHRDVKPGNVLLDDRGAYLGDFGLTKRVTSETRLTAHGQFVGTIDYMPPEQIQGGRLDPRSDAYAFACVLYHMLAGAPPFQRDTPVSVMYAQLREAPPPLSQRAPALPEAVDAVFARALAKRSTDRHASCGELVEETRAALGLDSAAQPLRLVPQTQPSSVLVAAADPRVRAAVRGMLGGERFVFTESETPEGALAAVGAARPDLVVLDWRLCASQADFCRRVRSAGGAPAPKLLALMSRAEAEQASTRVPDVDNVLRWPSSALQLQLKVTELLRDEHAA